MPLSTFNALRIPESESPDSISVMATAGGPTTTLSRYLRPIVFLANLHVWELHDQPCGSHCQRFRSNGHFPCFAVKLIV